MSVLSLACALLALAAAPARAATLVKNRTASGVDWVSAGVGGIPSDTADITLAGVTGPVTKAYLYWDGININGTIAINGNSITGTSLGDTSTICWGTGTSSAYVADVTPYVTGDGTYSLTELVQPSAFGANGASLVVLFDDGNPANNRDLIFYEGNDSTSIEATPAVEDRGWHGFLDGIVYRSGTVNAQFHVADGQSVNDGADSDVTLQGAATPLTITDTPTLWDGKSVPLQGTSRSPGDALWDIHTFDISALFHAAGTYGITLTSDSYPADCIALVAVIIDLAAAPPGPPPPVCGNGVREGSEECDDSNLLDGDCCDSTCHFEPAGTVCASAGDPCLEALCDGAGTCDAEGLSCRVPVAPEAGRLVLRHGRQDRLTWKWTTGVSTKADFGDPLDTTAYDLCLYDKGTGSLRLLARASASAGESCNGAPCWNETPRGYEYRNTAGPLQQLVLLGALPGRAQITARSAGGGLSLPLPLAPPVLVRLRARNGLCWGGNYSVPARNGRRRFSSRGDFYYPHAPAAR